jgi:hypothetical protein
MTTKWKNLPDMDADELRRFKLRNRGIVKRRSDTILMAARDRETAQTWLRLIEKEEARRKEVKP